MTTVTRVFNKDLFLVLALTTLLFLGGIVVLPGLDLTYASSAQAQTEAGAQALTATTQKWAAGWDYFNEPLNYSKSNIVWSVGTAKMTVSFKLVGANPTKLYQVGFDFYCSTFPKTFGQFHANENSDGTCIPQTHQGVTLNDAWVEVGTVLTDVHGNGSFKVVITGIVPGTYTASFHARDGAGCYVTGGGGNQNCGLDFQSPGPNWGDATTITIP